METPALLTRVGGVAVGPEYTAVPGTDATAEPPGLAVAWRAEDMARGWQRVLLARQESEAFKLRQRLGREAARARARAGAGGADAERWLAEAESLEELRAAEPFDEERFVRVVVAGKRVEDRWAEIAGRPLIVLGDHPDLGEALDRAMDLHPQVVHLPEA